jgi:hypothetical protein
VRVNATSATTQPTLEIFLSSDKSKRECALLTDFPNQLVDALKIEPVDITTDLHQFLEVPLASLNVLLVNKGIVGGFPSPPNDAETPAVDEIRGNERTHFEEQLQNHESVSSLATAPFETTIMESPTSSAATVEAAIPSLQQLSSTHAFNFRASVPQNSFRSPFGPNGQLTPSEEPVEAQSVEAVVTIGTYSTTNRSRNTDRIRHFALDPHTVSSSQTQNLRRTLSTHDAVFDLTELSLALQEVQPAQVHVQRATLRRTRLIPDRNPDERARDFEVGFLGEHFVSDSESPPIMD